MSCQEKIFICSPVEVVKNATVIWFIIKGRKTTLDVPYDTHGIAPIQDFTTLIFVMFQQFKF